MVRTGTMGRSSHIDQLLSVIRDSIIIHRRLGPARSLTHSSLIKPSYGNITLSRTGVRGQAHMAQHCILLTSHRPSYMALNHTITIRMIIGNLPIHPLHQLP